MIEKEAMHKAGIMQEDHTVQAMCSRIVSMQPVCFDPNEISKITCPFCLVKYKTLLNRT